MNNRQAGAHRELILKEQRSRETWMQHNMSYLQESGKLDEFMASNNMVPNRPPSSQKTRPPSSRNGRPPSRPQSNRSNRPASRAGAAGLNVTGTSSFTPADDTIYQQAVRVGSPRMVEEGDWQPPTIQRKVVRQVEVPYTREVKVPVKTRKIVPVKEKRKVKVSKLIEVPSFKMVDETYTEVVEEEAVREKEVWVKKIVPEKYMKKVPVTRVRQVKVPTTELKEVEDYEMVEVETNKAVEVDGFRVDQVEDTKLMEVEEYQTYELRPVARGPAKVFQQREVGPVKGKHYSRTVGSEVYHVNDKYHEFIDVDSHPDHVRVSRNTASARAPRSKPMRDPLRGTMSSRSGTYGTKSLGSVTSAQYHSMGSTRGSRGRGKVGLNVKNDPSGRGCVVHRVNEGQAAERAGVLSGDLITYVNNRPTRNLNEFRDVCTNAAGPLLVRVMRSGGRKLNLTIIR